MARRSGRYFIGQLKPYSYNLLNGAKRVSTYAKGSATAPCTSSENITRMLIYVFFGNNDMPILGWELK